MSDTDATATETQGNAKTGRPVGSSPRCTPELIAQASTLAIAGNYFEAIFTYLEIPKSTAYLWREEGEKGVEPYASFLDALQKGWAQAEVRIAAQLQQHGQEDKPGQWTALAWFLERRFSDRWARREKHEVSGPGGGPQEYRHTVTSVPEVLANPQAAEKACELEDLIAGIAPGATDPGGLCEED